MKKIIVLGIATCYAFSTYATQQVTNTGKSYLRFETPFQSASPERVSLFAAAPEIREKHRANHNGDFQIAVFGGRNNYQSQAAQYYFPKTSDGTITFNSSVTGDADNLGGNTLELYWNGTQDLTFGANSASSAQFAGTSNRVGYSTNAGGTLGTPVILATVASPGVEDELSYVDTTGSLIGVQILSGEATAINQGVIVTGNTAGSVSVPYDLLQVEAFVNGDAALGLTTNGFRLDSNRNTAVVRPWNFGIGYAPNVQMGENVTQSTFVSVISPKLERSQWGIGATWKQILSEKDTGFWLELSTALQRVSMNMKLNEDVVTELTPGTVPNWDTTDGYATAAITTITEAFAQEAWLYGKIDGARSVTRLADIELKLGYQFVCEDNVLSNGYVGMIIPTGNKATAEYMAEPIVGNGFHFGLMAGSTLDIQLNAGSETRWSSRSDACYRYLFKNTQKRSFDTNNGNWSRYMYVWDTYANEQLSETVSSAATMRAYTPGINVFTQDVNVTPQGIIRYNQAIVLESGGFTGEAGWNVLVRQDELVSLVNPWVDDQIVYADASQQLYSLYNANRTIYNDAYQSAPVPNTTALGSQTLYESASVKASDLNLYSAASWSTMVSTPYLVLGYQFNEEGSSIVSIGGSYEFTSSNDYISDWMLWGKFSMTF